MYQSGAPLVEASQIVGLQHQLDATRLLFAAQSHGFDPLARHIVETNGRARQQAIRMLDATGAEGDALPHQTAVSGYPKRLLRVDQRAHHPALVGEANGIDATDLDAFEQDGHPLLDGQIPRQNVDPLAARRLGQPFVKGKDLAFLRFRGVLGRVEGDAATQNGGKTAGLHIDPGQAEGALDAADVPEAGVGLDEVFKTRLDHQIQDHVLVLFAKAGVDDAAHLDAAKIELGADADRAE